MKAARAPRLPRDGVRLLWVDPTGPTGGERADTLGEAASSGGGLHDLRLGDLPGLLEPGDLCVVNDAATLPASIAAELRGARLELRLAEPPSGNHLRVVVFGDGDWRTPTEHRPAPPRLVPGDELRLAGDVVAEVTLVSSLSPRLVSLVVRDAAALWRALYTHGALVQYSYLAERLPFEAGQTLWAARPWAVEAPSAGLPLSWRIVEALGARGVHIATITHAAGLSATGDAVLDEALPLPERFEVTARTARAIDETRDAGGRVIAIGTSVVRAVESAVDPRGRARAASGVTSLKLGPGRALRLVDGLLTNMHQPGESHFELCAALADRQLLVTAVAHATARGYLCHELGDVTLVLPRSGARVRAAA